MSLDDAASYRVLKGLKARLSRIVALRHFPRNAHFMEVSSHVMSADDVRSCYRLFLGREAENEEVVGLWVGRPLESALAAFLSSDEFKQRVGNALKLGEPPKPNLSWISFRESALSWGGRLPFGSTYQSALQASETWPEAILAMISSADFKRYAAVLPRMEDVMRWIASERSYFNQLDSDIKLISTSDLFDASWYSEKYGVSFVDAARDYSVVGSLGERDPSEFFSGRRYLEQNADIASQSLNPLAHWLRHGRGERRISPVPLRQAELPQKAPLLLQDLCDPTKQEVTVPGSIDVLISIITPTYNTSTKLLIELYQTLVNQTYNGWEWILSDDGSSDPRTIATLRNLTAADERVTLILAENSEGISSASNRALKSANGEYVALVDHDDLLPRYVMADLRASVLSAAVRPDLVYTDECKLGMSGEIHDIYLKPSWSPALLENTMYLGHLTVYRTALVRELGGFRTSFDGTQDYDLALRVAGRAKHVAHISKIGYIWRAIPGSTALALEEKSYAVERQRLALESYSQANGFKATVSKGFSAGYWRLDYLLPSPAPLLSYIIPTAAGKRMVRGHDTDLLINCISSLEEQRFYPNYEIIVVHNGNLSSTQKEFLSGRPNVVLIAYEEAGLNLARKINMGAAAASGKYLCLLNDDVEVISPGGAVSIIAYMISHADVGAMAPLCLFEDGRTQHNGVLLLEQGPSHSGLMLAPEEPGHAGILQCRREQFGVSGAMMFIDRELYTVLGGFVESLPLNYNDVDFCLRVRSRGLTCVVDPAVKVFHFESASKTGTYKCEKESLFSRWPNLTDPYFNSSFDQRNPGYKLRSRDNMPSFADPVTFERWLDLRISHSRGVQEGSLVLSVGVSVYNQPPSQLNEMLTSLQMQSWANREIIILDNGSTSPETLDWLSNIMSLEGVIFIRCEENVGIAGGQRELLRRATGDLFIPIDADDFLTIDALAVMADFAERYPGSQLFYSDEFKSNNASDKFSPFFKTSFDPLMITNCCYPGHLMAIRTSFLRCVGGYDDDRATWCHDWDTVFRAIAVGCEPMHVPELLYAWRVSPGSTASADTGAKPEANDSQEFVLKRAIAQRGLDDTMSVVVNTVGPRTGMWSLVTSQPVSSVTVLAAEELWGAGGANPAKALEAGATKPGWTAILLNKSNNNSDDVLLKLSAPAKWESRVAVVSGCLSNADGQHVRWSGGVFTPDGIVDPSRGQKWVEGGYHGRLFCQRCVDIAAPINVLIHNERLVDALAFLRSEGVPVSGDSLMVALGILASKESWLIAVTPLIRPSLPPNLSHVIPVDRLGLSKASTISRWYNPANSAEQPYTPRDYAASPLFGVE